MKYLKILSLAAIAAAALMAFAGSASATELTSSAGGAMVTTGSTIASASEGEAVLDSAIGEIKCESEVEGTTSNTGGSGETVSGNISKLTFVNCTDGADVTAIAGHLGSLEIHTRNTSADNNGTLTSFNSEVTVEVFGFHCIFRTSASGTDIGTVTGSSTTGGTATLDISATIPRTGGRSGAFCGSSAPWTGSYKVSSPDFLNVD